MISVADFDDGGQGLTFILMQNAFNDIAGNKLPCDAVIDRDTVYDRIFAELGDYDYGKVFRWIYDNNAALKSSGKKYHDVFEAIET